jgi:biopolymer transport protein ExbB
VLSIIEAAGWPIWTIILASVVSLAIIFERFYSLRQSLVAPAGLLEDVLNRSQAGDTRALYEQLVNGAPLARILAAGLKNQRASREVMKEAIEEAGRVVAHELERFLTTLGTIAAMAPLLGLLGTVVGMIELFGASSPTGTNPQQLAHGISVALYNTAFGLVVAIPSMIFYRHFRAKVDALLVTMEQQAIHLVDVVHGDRDR